MKKTITIFQLIISILIINNSIFSQGNTPCSATAITPNTTCINTSGTTVGQTYQSDAANGGIPSCASPGAPDVWYTVTPTVTGTYTITTAAGTIADGGLAIYSAATCSTSFVSISCNDDGGPNSPMSQVTAALNSGTTYYIRVWRFSSGTGTFNICVVAPPVPPANDNCSGSFTVPVNSATTCVVTSTATSSGATQSQAGCSGTADDDVWFSFVAAATSQTITVTPASMSNVVVQAFSGNCAGLTSLGCENATSGTSAESEALSGLTIGATYFFRVFSSASGTGAGTFTICITTPIPPPSNDEPNTATSISPGTTCTYTTFTNFNATNSSCGTIPAPGCASYSGGDVWFSIVVPSSGAFVLDSQTGGMTDGGMAIYSGTPCGVLALIDCDDDASANGSMPSLTITGQTPGTTLYIRFWEFSNDNNGTFGLCATISPPSNNNCSGAIALTVNSSSVCASQTSGNTEYATQSSAGCVGNADDDVWYSFVATSTNHTVTVTPNTISDVVFQLYSGSCGSLSSFGCINSTSGSTAEIANATSLTIGNTYFIRVYSFGSGTGTFSVCVTSPPPPANDNCIGSFTVPVNTTGSCVVTLTATSIGATQSQSGCTGTADDDVWFSFVATATTHTVTVTPSTMNDVVVQFFNGACAGLTSIGCIDGPGGSSPEISNLTGLTIGTTYFFRVFSFGNASNAGTFTICIVPPPPPPANDNCTGAYSVAVSPGTTCSSLTNGTLLGATASTQTNSCAGGNDDDDVWYTFVATSTSHTINITNVSGNITDMYHSVFGGTCGSIGGAITCSDPNTSSVFGLTIGSTYFIRVYTYGSTTGANTTFSVCVTTPPPTGPCGNQLTNDFCSNPATLTQGPGTFSSSTSSIYSADQSSPLFGIFCGSLENNSWYSFIATGPTAVFPFTTVAGCFYGDGVQAEVYSVSTNTNGCCTGFTSVSNCFNPGVQSTGTVTATGLVTGQKYILMVDGYAGDVCNFAVSNWTAVGILPLHLMTFIGHNEGEKNKIQWVTSSEINTDYFVLEKSNNGIDFEILLNTKAAGESSSTKYYNAFDLNPFEEITYYRLKLLNLNGTFEYSNIISVDNKNLTDYITSVRPNPTSNNIEFDVNTINRNKITIEILNNIGNILSTEERFIEEGIHTIKQNLEGYNSGIYLVKITFENSGKSLVEKIIKQ